jgi:hypothetical protein
MAHRRWVVAVVPSCVLVSVGEGPDWPCRAALGRAFFNKTGTARSAQILRVNFAVLRVKLTICPAACPGRPIGSEAELDRERRIAALPPVLRGAALVVPAGLLAARAEPAPLPAFADAAADRAAVERCAMEVVIAAKRRMGFEPRDVSAEDKGWDIESRDPGSGHLRFIEVKGRHAEAFFLALVRVEAGLARAPICVRRFFERDLGFAETAVVFDLAELISLRRPKALGSQIPGLPPLSPRLAAVVVASPAISANPTSPIGRSTGHCVASPPPRPAPVEGAGERCQRVMRSPPP